MVIIQAAGGLGNQLQQYALYRKFLSLGTEARLDISWFTQEGKQDGVLAKRKLELSYLNGISFIPAAEAEKKILTGGDGFGGKLRRKLLQGSVRRFRETQIYHPELLSFTDMYLEGYFACEKYYADILETMRKEISFPIEDNPANKALSREMESCQSVSVHVRRGDYLDKENAAMFGGICTEDYYRGAIRWIKELCPQARFYIFSDDIAYVREHFQGEEYRVVDINHGKDSFLDIYLMSCCKHNICANSTFSFWGARLNGHEDKLMIRPTIHKNSQVFVKQEMEELWKGWLFVDPEGLRR